MRPNMQLDNIRRAPPRWADYWAAGWVTAWRRAGPPTAGILLVQFSVFIGIPFSLLILKVRRAGTQRQKLGSPWRSHSHDVAAIAVLHVSCCSLLLIRRDAAQSHALRSCFPLCCQSCGHECVRFTFRDTPPSKPTLLGRALPALLLNVGCLRYAQSMAKLGMLLTCV